MKVAELKKHIRDIPNFPKKGIIFKDISTLLKNPKAFAKSIDTLGTAFKKSRIVSFHDLGPPVKNKRSKNRGAANRVMGLQTMEKQKNREARKYFSFLR